MAPLGAQLGSPWLIWTLCVANLAPLATSDSPQTTQMQLPDFIFDGKSKQESLESDMIEIGKFLDESHENDKVKDQKSSLSSFKLDNKPNFKN